MLNADEYLIFSNPDCLEYVEKLYKPLRTLRRSALAHVEEIADFDLGDGYGKIQFKTGRTEIDYKPDLSFLRINNAYVNDRTMAYKEHFDKYGLSRLFVRDEELYAFVSSESKKLIKEILQQSRDEGRPYHNSS